MNMIPNFTKFIQFDHDKLVATRRDVIIGRDMTEKFVGVVRLLAWIGYERLIQYRSIRCTGKLYITDQQIRPLN